jgi:RNA recognition motif-containing protein
MPSDGAGADKDFDFDEIYGRSTSRWDPEKEKKKEANKSTWGPPGANIFASGMPYSFDKAKIKDLFAEHGKILSVLLRKTGSAYISFEAPKQASCAIVAIDSLRLEGRSLSVTISKDQYIAEDSSASDDEDEEEDDDNMPPLSFSGRTTKAQQVRMHSCHTSCAHADAMACS